MSCFGGGFQFDFWVGLRLVPDGLTDGLGLLGWNLSFVWLCRVDIIQVLVVWFAFASGGGGVVLVCFQVGSLDGFGISVGFDCWFEGLGWSLSFGWWCRVDII